MICYKEMSSMEKKKKKCLNPASYFAFVFFSFATASSFPFLTLFISSPQTFHSV